MKSGNYILLLMLFIAIFLSGCGGGDDGTPPPNFELIPGDILIEVSVAANISDTIVTEKINKPAVQAYQYHWRVMFDLDYSGALSVGDILISASPDQTSYTDPSVPITYESSIWRIIEINETNNGYSAVLEGRDDAVVHSNTVYMHVNTHDHTFLSNLNSSVPVSFDAVTPAWTVINSEPTVSFSIDFYPSHPLAENFLGLFTSLPGNGILIDEQNLNDGMTIGDTTIPFKPLSDLRKMKVTFH